MSEDEDGQRPANRSDPGADSGRFVRVRTPPLDFEKDWTSDQRPSRASTMSRTSAIGVSAAGNAENCSNGRNEWAR
jgi:hypothetical protein